MESQVHSCTTLITLILNVHLGAVDFMLVVMQVVIPSTTTQGQGVCVAAIDIFGDTIVEGNETFQLMIQPTNPLDMVSPGGNTTTVTIVDDDGKYTSTSTAVSPYWITGHELHICNPQEQLFPSMRHTLLFKREMTATQLLTFVLF